MTSSSFKDPLCYTLSGRNIERGRKIENYTIYFSKLGCEPFLILISRFLAVNSLTFLKSFHKIIKGLPTYPELIPINFFNSLVDWPSIDAVFSVIGLYNSSPSKLYSKKRSLPNHYSNTFSLWLCPISHGATSLLK